MSLAHLRWFVSLPTLSWIWQPAAYSQAVAPSIEIKTPDLKTRVAEIRRVFAELG